MTKRSSPKPAFIEGEFNLPDVEQKVLAFWDKHHIFERSLEKEDGAKEFVFYEGPPYANGKPAIHHVISRIVKDVILRYKTMQGFRVPRRAGWDTHGLPVEMAAEKALGFKTKRDIEEYGVKKFNEVAKEQVWIYKDEWERMTHRIGYWLDLKNAYVTYEPEYIESMWWTMAQIAKRDLLYKGHKVVPWCTRCGTALSSHELAQGYQEVEDESVFVKFKLKPKQNIGANFVTDKSSYILSWTTTPWTLPGNVALAVGEDIDYVSTEKDGERLWYAKESPLGRELGIGEGIVKGKELVGLEYEPLFDVEKLQSPKSYKIYPADFVTTADGTGVVHTAVMYGEDDYVLGKKEGLPEHHTVNEEGKFTKDVRPLAGMYVKAKETNDAIFEYLKEHGNLLRTEHYKHEYPFCWRCGTPVLYYARTSWFIAMSKLHRELLENNASVNWQPAHVKAGRFGEWLKEAKDWNLSRERYWGAPLPIWECAHCGHREVVASMDELSVLAGGSKNHYWGLRHGESENITLDVIDSGNQDFHLTPHGREEVIAAAEKLKAEKIDMIISSDIPRTKETSEIVAKVLGLKVHFDGRLREIQLGSWSGRSGDDYRKAFVHEPDDEKKITTHVEDGAESLEDVRNRAWQCVEELERNHEDKRILIVSHEDTLWMLSQAMRGWSDRETMRRKFGKAGERWNFMKPAEVIEMPLKVIPRDDTGHVDLHRPFADAIAFPCAECKKGEMKRVLAVADVWYDSGAMPYGQVHFPFGDAVVKDGKPEGLPFPADYIAEGMDQTRGWFYTLMAISTALGYGAPYKNVVALGLINDKFGRKMSKSKGNVVEPFAVIDKYGVDALRWYFFTGSPLGEPKNFDENEIAEAFRRTHLIIYNSFIFWKTYADHNAVLEDGMTVAEAGSGLDGWILARLDETSRVVKTSLDAYEIREAALELDRLVDDLSRWYIRRSRRRLQKPSNPADYQAASATLRHALLSLVTMMAPFTPFMSEALYAALDGIEESVHLAAWPALHKKDVASAGEEQLLFDMAAVRTFAAAGLAKRAEAGIKVRQPLASMTVPAALGKELRAILAEEVNVKEVITDANAKEPSLDTTITPELREEGLFRDIVRMFQELRQKAELSPKDKIVAIVELPADAAQAIANREKAFMEEVGATSVEYKRSGTFNAEEETKVDGAPAWVAIRKI